MFSTESFVWQPLLQASAETIASILGTYAAGEAIRRFRRFPRYYGAMDFWKRGIRVDNMGEGDRIEFDGVISPYFQLFPNDPLSSIANWNQLYEFEGRIDKAEFQTMEFFAGSDALLRVGAVNGDTLVGLFSQYAFAGDGLLGLVPTTQLRKVFPNFFNPNFSGSRARIRGELARCPHEHHTIARQMLENSGVERIYYDFSNLVYLRISEISPMHGKKAKTWTLRGTPWAVTSDVSQPYLLNYTYISEPGLLQMGVKQIQSKPAWNEAQVFFDDISSPSESLRFGRKFLAI